MSSREKRASNGLSRDRIKKEERDVPLLFFMMPYASAFAWSTRSR